ncbi:MAG: nitrate reductase [Hyphomicrobiales bacterium]|nr:nitrate reductase [Hyphomicrobiales bacterium]
MNKRDAIATTCAYCGVGCGVRAECGSGGAVRIEGDRDHPANFGRLCVKGAALAETLVADERLLHPQIGGVRASWSMALDLVARRFSETIAMHGPESVAFYVSGQLLTEDYYVANKLMKGFIGSANIDTNSRLCMSASVAGHKRAFGADVVPGVYEDLETADLIVLVGSNLAWCHPVLFQRIAKAREARNGLPRVVNIDPRRTATSEIADLHLAIEPGTDVALFLGLLREIGVAAAIDVGFVGAHTEGAERAQRVADDWTIQAVARRCGLSREDVSRFYDLFVRTEKAVTVYSQGVNQSSAGVDKVNAILNCHLVTNRIGRPGMGPFSVTGQPNAMGGREVGGLANQLAAHMELDNPAHRAIVQSFWSSPRLPTAPGLKAVDLFRAIGDGRVKAVWIMGTNPVDSLPDADAVRGALANCPFVVVSDVVEKNDTTAYAHVLLPAQAWGEKDGTVTNSERRVSRQRGFRGAIGEAMPDWWAVCGVARRMGFAKSFDYGGPASIFREHAALSGVGNHGARAFDISGAARISDLDYQSMRPFRWPWRCGEPANETPKRFFANGTYFTANERARIVETPFREPMSKRTIAAPFILNTGRVRDQWHTMTRTGVAPRLAQHICEPFVEIAPRDAEQLGVEDDGLVRISNARGAIVARARVTEGQRDGSIFAPIHWTDQFASAGRVDALVAPHLDPIAGQPESKASVARVEALRPDWFAFALSRVKPDLSSTDYWALARIAGGFRFELAGFAAMRDWRDYAAELFALTRADRDLMLTMEDRHGGFFRCVASVNGAVVGALYASRKPLTVSRAWLCSALGAVEPMALLAGRPAGAKAESGAQICACHSVGAHTIRDAVAGGCRDVRAVGVATAAGTGCGSCRPEIERILRQAPTQYTPRPAAPAFARQ